MSVQWNPYTLAKAFKSTDYDALRIEMRNFYPDECHENCKAPAIVENYKEIVQELDEWFEANPDVSVFSAKKKFYETIGKKFKPVIFRNMPFYFEGGVNGGWISQNIGFRWFKKHFEERFADTLPKKRINRFRARNSERFSLCCGFFIDEIHHISPISAILKKGFGGIYEEARKSSEKCSSRSEKQWFDAMLAGLEAVHEIQLKFAAEAERILREEKLTQLQHADMKRIAEAATLVPWEPPRTFFEALNTAWFLREILGITDGLAVYSLGHPKNFLKPTLRRAD